MSTSQATVTPANIILTPMRVTLFPAGSPMSGGVDLGGTTGGVDLSIKTQYADIMVDQFGKTVLNKIVSGHTFTMKTVLAEAANKANWKVAFPNFQLAATGTGIFVFNMEVGDDLLSKAGKLVLHPLSKPNSDLSEDITINLAACTSATELKFGPDKQIGLSVEFEIFPDTTVIPARFLTFGDPTINLVVATAAAATAGSNTGNGTITSQLAYSGYTATETVTILCIGVDSTHGDIFTVTGSVSGLLGEFTLGHTSGNTFNFTNPKLSFTATQGSATFVYGDSFTIATVASNYA
jgi:hypothetical protein